MVIIVLPSALRILQKRILNTTEESIGNGQFPRKVPNTKIKSESIRSSKQSHNPQRNRKGHRKSSNQKKKKAEDQMILVQNSIRPSKKT